MLVTGGAGFLGRYVVAALIKRGDQVSSFQRSAAPDLEADGVDVKLGSLTDAASVASAIRGQDAVIHVAAKAGVWGRREDFEAINVQGTRNVVDGCRAAGVRWLVHTSTPSVVFSGQPFSGADESLPYGQNWLCHYAESKAQAECDALAAHGQGLSVCALRPHLIWGVGDPHLLPRVIARARAGRLKIIGNGTNRVDLTHVRNAADAHLQALDALREDRCGGKAYFLSQGEPVVLWEWINGLLHRLHLPPVQKRIGFAGAYRIGFLAECIWAGLRLPGEPPMTRFVATELAKDHWFSIDAARKDLGFCPERHPTDSALVEYVASLR